MQRKHVVMWGRRHSIDRVHRRGDWIGMGWPVPVVTPLEAPPEPPAPPGPEPDPELEAAPRNGLRHELESAARAGADIEPHRGRGRPRKPDERRR